MATQIKHVAIISDHYALDARFYGAIFGMKAAPSARPDRGAVIGDGYVGMNINPRKAGRHAGLDHFGLEVDDIESACTRIREKYPAIGLRKSPGDRPFAAVSTHDPAGNLFDLSQRGLENRAEVYAQAPTQHNRYISHFALRALNIESAAQFYLDVFDLKPTEKPPGDPNFYLADGRVTLVLMPRRIGDYQGTGIPRPGPGPSRF